MTWYMNFCAPYIPNDNIINFYRYVQATILVIYTLFYALLNIYYTCRAPKVLSPEENCTNEPKRKEANEISPDQSDMSSQNKEVSIKLDQQANDSCIQLKKTATTAWDKNSSGKYQNQGIIDCVTISEIQQYCPIVYGHFAISMGLSVMYTPYAEQTISAILYVLLTIPLLMANAGRHYKATLFFWILMVMILLFILTCGLLEVGQSNWDILNLDCFANKYISLYD